MSAIATALAPILIIILLGYGLKRGDFLHDQSWSGIEKLTYYVLFPSLLVHSLGKQSIAGTPWPSMLLVLAAALSVAAVVLILWHLVGKAVSGATFTSVFQGGVRFNTYIALAVAEAFFGAGGLAMGALAAGFMIVLINILCISAFARWGANASSGVKPFIRDIIANPLILACALGWFLSLSGIGLPGITGDILEIPGRAALPLGLLAVGAALRPESVRGHIQSIVVSSAVQFGVKPLIAVLLISATALSGVPAGVLVIALMSPTAPSAYILARQLGGDTSAMASIITVQTLLAFLAMPVIAVLVLK